MKCLHIEPAAFIALWDTCSPTIQHLCLRCHTDSPDSVRPSRPTSSAAVLRSLKLYASNVDEWLKDSLCPFDLSRLAILSISGQVSVLGWKRMAPSLQTIEALDFACFDVLDLTLLPNLSFLRIDFTSNNIDMTLGTLSTIPSSTRICQIVLYIQFPTVDTCGQLDSAIASLPVPYLPSVGLEEGYDEYQCWAPHFPQLSSRNQLYSTEYDWFEAQIHRKDMLQ
ncbi:hypothetical protein K438DRAFT_1101358 [Mycena galopus ATCC 62051]|nr:hypothetical protein K438DRAFT_1101358 [Mycena galopus ATCC 62051]